MVSGLGWGKKWGLQGPSIVSSLKQSGVQRFLVSSIVLGLVRGER